MSSFRHDASEATHYDDAFLGIGRAQLNILARLIGTRRIAEDGDRIFTRHDLIANVGRSDEINRVKRGHLLEPRRVQNLAQADIGVEIDLAFQWVGENYLPFVFGVDELLPAV